MAGFAEGRATWVQIFPTQERIVDGAEASGPLLVDVGGSHGQDTKRFHEKHPQSAGRLIVQDLESVIEQVKKGGPSTAIEFQIHDIYNTQPVLGARVYLLHHIFHDWSDELCRKTLLPIKAAMKVGSKLLVGEWVVASRNPDPLCTTLDLTVATVTGAKEHTEQAWRDLFSSVGLRLAAICTAPSANGQSVMEVVLDAAH